MGLKQNKKLIAGGIFRYVDAEGFAPTEPLTKGERTNRRLLQAALDSFHKNGYHASRVSDITERASISAGAFYLYFKDKEAIALELMKLLLDRLTRYVLDTPRAEDAFEAILEANKRYADFYRQGGEFNRAALQIRDALPEVKAMVDAVNAAVSRRVAEALKRRIPDTADYENERHALAYAMIGMIDSIYIEYFSNEKSPMRAFFSAPEDVIEFASVLWYRALFGVNPESHDGSRILSIMTRFVLPGSNSSRQP